MRDGEIPLLTERHRVIRNNTRGHGRSEAPPRPTDLIGDVLAVIDHHGARATSYMGASLGGMTGLGLALQHPDRIERLVCCDARADNPEPFVKSWDDRVAVGSEKRMDDLVAGTIERWLTLAFRAAHPEEEAKLAGQIRTTSPEGYKGCTAALKTLNDVKDLGPQAIADAAPGGRLAIVPKAAHIANINNPADFTGALKSLGPQRSPSGVRAWTGSLSKRTSQLITISDCNEMQPVHVLLTIRPLGVGGSREK